MICGITTAPRPNGVSYLRETVESLLGAGFKNIFVFSEPGSDIESVSGLPVWHFQRQKTLGNWHNWLAMAQSLVELSGSDLILTCEDDVRFVKESATALEIIARKIETQYDTKAGPICAYTSSIHQKQIGATRVGRITNPNLTGACALAWNCRGLKKVLTAVRNEPWNGISGQDTGKSVRHSDVAIGSYCFKTGLYVFGLNPCLANHIGHVSSVHDAYTGPEMYAENVAHNNKGRG